jgi:hypothetical protein
MTIPSNRLSTTVLDDDWLPPHDRPRLQEEDFEQGPRGISDTSLGLKYQPWHLTWSFITGDFTATPETEGGPAVVHNVASGVTQCSLAFDQNARAYVAYTELGIAKLYWFDTVPSMFVVTALATGAKTPMITLDDKRTTQTNSNDIVLAYIKPVLGVDNLYTMEQRDRFGVEYLMSETTPLYMARLGMHKSLRLQFGLTDIFS